MIKVGVTAAVRRHGPRCSAYFKVNHRGDASGVVKSLHGRGDVRVSSPEGASIVRTRGDTEVVLQPRCRLLSPSTPLFKGLCSDQEPLFFVPVSDWVDSGLLIKAG